MFYCRRLCVLSSRRDMVMFAGCHKLSFFFRLQSAPGGFVNVDVGHSSGHLSLWCLCRFSE